MSETTDDFGRPVAISGDTYTVTNPDNTTFIVEAPTEVEAMHTIDAMAPAGYVPPNPSVISSLAFLERFTPLEQAAVWQAAVTNPAIGVGLQQGMATGTINLLSPIVSVWMAALVTAGAITSPRSTAILTV